MFSLRFRRNQLWPLGIDRLLRLGRGGGGGFGGEDNFLRGLILRVNLENAQNVRGSKY